MSRYVHGPDGACTRYCDCGEIMGFVDVCHRPSQYCSYACPVYRATVPTAPARYVRTDPDVGSWPAPGPNAIWTLPDGVGEVRGESTCCPGWFAAIRTYRALACDAWGRIYGMRSLSHPRESGHDLEGRVSIGGRSYRAVTGSQLFERPDRTLRRVAILYVCFPSRV